MARKKDEEKKEKKITRTIIDSYTYAVYIDADGVLTLKTTVDSDKKTLSDKDKKTIMSELGIANAVITLQSENTSRYEISVEDFKKYATKIDE